MTESIYAYKADRLNGGEVSLKDFQGKVLLIVNTASQCGFTPHYAGLQKLYEKYKGQGFEVLGFPCNQFGAQEPGNAEEIAAFCDSRYHISFPLFAKVEVNGEHAHPLYQYLKSHAKGLLGTEAIKWNFTKFLVDRNGQVVARYAPTTPPEKLEKAIQVLLDGR